MIRQPYTAIQFGAIIPYQNTQVYVVALPDQLPTFQIVRASNVFGLSDISIELISTTGAVIDVKALMSPTDPLQLMQLTNNTDVLIYSQNEVLISDIPAGQYYVKVSDTVNIWYSQVMLKIKCYTIETPLQDLFYVSDLIIPIS